MLKNAPIIEARMFSKKSVKQINFTPIDWSRFNGCPVKPGILFFKMFEEVRPEGLVNLKGVNLPDTLMSFERLTWLKFGKQIIRVNIWCRYC